MSVLVLGVNHRTAPVDLLDRLAVSDEQQPKALASLVARRHVGEAVVLSTCNRVEVYAQVSRYHGGLGDLRAFMSEWSGLAPEDFVDRTYDLFDEAAARHLFAVASGLDSMVIGERQIGSQVKRSFRTAQAEQHVGRLLDAVFTGALRTARRVRTETRIADSGRSIVDLAVRIADDDLGGLAGRHVLVVGAGKIGGMAGQRLVRAAGSVTIANRSADRAEGLAQRLRSHPGAGDVGVVDLVRLPAAIARADLVVCSTGSASPLLTPDMLDGRPPGRPLAIVDLAVPRDVDRACADVDGVVVRGIEDLRALVVEGPAATEVEAAAAIVEEEALRFAGWRRSVQAEPTVKALRARAEGIRLAELARLSGRLAGLDARQRGAVESLTRGIVNTLLHEPTVRLKALGDDDPDGRALALRELFDLPEHRDGAPGAEADPPA